MVKFSSSHTVLDVKKIAMYKVDGAYLFSQLLMVLSALGVPTDVFNTLQQLQLVHELFGRRMYEAAESTFKSLQKMAAQEGRTMVQPEEYYQLEMLRDLMERGCYQDAGGGKVSLSVKDLDNVEKALKHAKCKNNVYSKKTVMLLGVLDEPHDSKGSLYLEEGEVLVGNGTVAGVDVLISRSPCESCLRYRYAACYAAVRVYIWNICSFTRFIHIHTHKHARAHTHIYIYIYVFYFFQFLLILVKFYLDFDTFVTHAYHVLPRPWRVGQRQPSWRHTKSQGRKGPREIRPFARLFGVLCKREEAYG